MRNPLNALSVGIEVLKLTPALGPSEKETLAMMEEASVFMRETLDTVLNMQKIEEGKFELELAPFSIRKAILRIASIYSGVSRKKNIKFTFSISEDIPVAVLGDCQRIEHVISNLLSNAMKFTPCDKSVHLRAFCESPNAESIDMSVVSIHVTDEGPGISEENQKLLFNTFVQIRPQKLQMGQGSGLGLSFCKELVSMHNGNISVMSKEGEGSTFMLSIPFPLVTSTNLITNVDILEQSVRSSNTDGCIDSLNVLLVDDSELNVKILKTLLSKRKLKCETAENGRIAVDMVLVDLDRFKLIIMDNLMPVMSGVEATVVLREAGFKYYIVGLTGVSNDDEIDPFLKAGADLVLPKPLELASLDNLLQQMEMSGPDSQREVSLQFPSFPLMKEPIVESASYEVLIVDDAKSNLKILSMMLKKKGLKSDTAENGQIAVDMVLVDLDRFKLIIMDNLMPVMSGVEATVALREAGFRNLIVGLTGNIMDDDIRQFLVAGADYVLSKPLQYQSIEKLVQFIDKNGYCTRVGMKLVLNGKGLFEFAYTDPACSVFN